jgi:hypothetical protein
VHSDTSIIYIMSSSRRSSLVSSKVTPGKESLSVNLQQTRYEVVKESAMRHGYVDAGDAEDWDLCWSDLSVTVDRVAAMKVGEPRLNEKGNEMTNATTTITAVSEIESLPWHARHMPQGFPDQNDVKNGCSAAQ